MWFGEPATGGPSSRDDRPRTTAQQDLYEYALDYGSGAFVVPGFSDIVEVFNPFSNSCQRNVAEMHDILREHKRIEGNEYVPFGVFPDNPGLLAWGCGGNQRAMFWLTDGQPLRWPVVLLTPDHKFVRLAKSMAAFLAALFCGEIDSFGGSFSTDWCKENKHSFQFTVQRR